MKKYVLNIDRLYSGQTANALVLRQVDEDFPVLLPSVPHDVEDLSVWIEKCMKIHPDFQPPSGELTRESLNECIVDFNLDLQNQFRKRGHSELYMMDDTSSMRPARRTSAIDKTYLHCLNGADEQGRNVSQMNVLFPYKKMSSKSLYSSYLQIRRPDQMDDILEFSRRITLQGKTTYQECLQGVSQVGNQLYVMSPNIDLDSGTIYGNNLTVMNGHGIPRSFPPTMTLFQPSRSRYNIDNLQKDPSDGVTDFIEWYGRNNHKTRIGLNPVYGTSITTLESIGPSSYDIQLPTYSPNYLLFMQGDTLSDGDEWLALDSSTFRDIRGGRMYLDRYENGKYIIDNERKSSDFPNVGLLMNLYDTFITEHDRTVRMKVQKDPDYNRFVFKFDWQVVMDNGLPGTLDVVLKVGFKDDEKTKVFETTFTKSTQASTYTVELTDMSLHSHEIDIVVMMRYDVDFSRRNMEREYRNCLRRSGFLLSNFRVFQDEVERKDNLTFGDYVNQIGIDTEEREKRYNQFWRVSQYKKDLAYQTVVETSLRNLTSSGISYSNNYSSGDLYGDMFVTKSVLDPRYDMNISLDELDENMLLSEGRDYIGLGSCSNQLSLFYRPTEIHIGIDRYGDVVTRRVNPEQELNYQMVEVVKNINRFESSIKHKSNVFSVVVENSNLAPDNSSSRNEELEKYKEQLRNSVTQFVRNTCESIVPVHTQLFDVQFT